MDYSAIRLSPIALFRKEQVWMAEGDDLAIYNANKTNLQNLLEHSGIPESDHKLWIGIYRIGANQDEARPAIVVSCLDSKVRKQAKGSIKNCSLLRPGEPFAHFAVRGKATPPELPCEPQLTMAGNAQVHGLAPTISSSAHQPEELTNQGPEGDIQENIEHQIVLQLFGSHTGDSYLCRPIQARRGLQRQSATAGPLVLLDGVSYQLTVEHVVNFDHHNGESAWEHTNDDWDDDDDDDDIGDYQHFDGMPSLNFDTIRTMSKGSLSSEEAEIDSSSSSSSSSAQGLEADTSWSHMAPASTSPLQSSPDPKKVGHILVNDYSSSPLDPISSRPCSYISARMDYLLFPIHLSPELCTTRGAEIVQLSDVFEVHRQTKARSVIITTASLGYVRGTIFPASTLLQKPGSRNFQTLFCIESASPMPKGTSGSAVFDAHTGLLAGYLVLGCPGKQTCYMVPMYDVLAELNMLSGSIAQCQVQLGVSAIVEIPPERSSLVRNLSFHAGGHNRSTPSSSIAPREESPRRDNRPVLGHPLGYLPDAIHGSTHHVKENQRAKDGLRDPLRFLRGSKYAARLTSISLEWVDWSELDEWKKRLGQMHTTNISVENRPFLDLLKENGIEGLSELQVFCQPSCSSPRWDRIVSRIARFCEGASFDQPAPCDTENPVWVSFVKLPGKSISHNDKEHLCQFLLLLVVSFEQVIDEKNCNERSCENSTFGDIQEPVAWVSDRNCAPEGLPPPQRFYGRTLDCTELYEVLQKKRFRDDASAITASHCRRIYINNPNGSSLLALIRTTPASQVEGLRQLFANYVTPIPGPVFHLRESAWWGGCFVIFFNLPFLTIRTQNGKRVRTDPTEKKPIRRSYDLSFLNLKDQGTSVESEDCIPHHEVFLKEAVCSLVVTGKSERYWTAVFLDEDSFDEEPRLCMEGEEDPIILKDETSATATTSSPRAYALAALKTALYKIIEHYEGIQDCLKDSFNHHILDVPSDPPSDIDLEYMQEWTEKFQEVLNHVTHSSSNLSRKLDRFLSDDVILDMGNALPHGVLWQSVQNEPDALRSLLRIEQYRNKLRNVDKELRQLSTKDENETRNYHSEEETFLFPAHWYGYRLKAVNQLVWTKQFILVMLIATIVWCVLVVCLRRHELHEAWTL